ARQLDVEVQLEGPPRDHQPGTVEQRRRVAGGGKRLAERGGQLLHAVRVAEANHFSRLFCTLPMAFRGSASSRRSSRGSLYGASASRANARRSSSVIGGAVPARGTTQAVTRSPHTGSGTPMTATSATTGWRASTASISSADSL